MEGLIFCIVIVLLAFYISACLKVLSETEPENSKVLVKIGSLLVIGSGFLLSGLQFAASWLKRPTEREMMCNIYFDGKVTIAGIESLKCEEYLQNIWVKIPEWVTLLIIDAFSWVVPLVFAAIGVNTIAHGLINNYATLEQSENSNFILKPIIWFHEKFVALIKSSL